MVLQQLRIVDGGVMMPRDEQICQKCRFWDAKDYIVPDQGRCTANRRMIRNRDDRCDCERFEEETDEPDDDF